MQAAPGGHGFSLPDKPDPSSEPLAPKRRQGSAPGWCRRETNANRERREDIRNIFSRPPCLRNPRRTPGNKLKLSLLERLFLPMFQQELDKDIWGGGVVGEGRRQPEPKADGELGRAML